MGEVSTIEFTIDGQSQGKDRPRLCIKNRKNFVSCYKIPKRIIRKVSRQTIEDKILPILNSDIDDVTKAEKSRVKIKIGIAKPDGKDKPKPKSSLTTKDLEGMLKNMGKELRAKGGRYNHGI